MDIITQRLVCSQKAGKKGPDAVRRSLQSRYHKTGGICGKKGRSTDTDCQHAPTQHQLSNLEDSQMPQKSSRKEQNK